MHGNYEKEKMGNSKQDSVKNLNFGLSQPSEIGIL